MCGRVVLALGEILKIRTPLPLLVAAGAPDPIHEYEVVQPLSPRSEPGGLRTGGHDEKCDLQAGDIDPSSTRLSRGTPHLGPSVWV
jgi:hypothetical protein